MKFEALRGKFSVSPDQQVHGHVEFTDESDTSVSLFEVNLPHAYLTRTLEFIFGASDLLESGWDIKAWASRGSSLTHAFGEYLVTFKDEFRVLKSALAEAKAKTPGV